MKIKSTTEVLSVEVKRLSSARLREDARIQRGDISWQSKNGDTRRRLQRSYARVKATRALARTSPPEVLRSSGRYNPLLAVAVGSFMSQADCELILTEAKKEDGHWVPWDGEYLGQSSAVKSLDALPESRALWVDRQARGTICARIAGMYGLPQSSIVIETSDVYVCKVAVEEDCCGQAEKMLGQEQRLAGGGRAEAAIDSAEKRQHQTSEYSVEAQRFSRSESLVTFYVVLSAEGEVPAWAVCLEQRAQCIRPCGQGAGVAFSGKLRHQTVTMTSSEALRGGTDASDLDTEGDPVLEPSRAPVVLLRGFASIHHPSIRDDLAQWEWGYPAWHVDAPWVKDQDILDRVWVDGRAPPPANHSATKLDGYYLERMNSSTAHRYYRQGLEGMNIPLLDSRGRPVIDLAEDRPPLRLPWGSKKTTQVTVTASLRRRFFPWDRRRQVVGKAGLSIEAGTSPKMDAALQTLFGGSSAEVAAGEGERRMVRVPVPPIKYVFVDPRYRGLGLGRRLFLEAMCILARRGFRFALIVVEDNGSGTLFGFYEEMGFVRAEEVLGIPRAMIAPIPPPDNILLART